MPLERHPAGALVDVLSRRIEVFRVAQPAAAAREQTSERFLPREQRLPPQVTSVEEEQVERHVGGGGGSGLGGLLQALEARDACRVEHDDLAVEQGFLHAQVGRRFRDRGKAIRPVQSIAREQRGAPALDAEEQAIPVELDLVHPVIADRRRRHQRGKLGRNPCGQGHRTRVVRRFRTPSISTRKSYLRRSSCFAACVAPRASVARSWRDSSRGAPRCRSPRRASVAPAPPRSPAPSPACRPARAS